MTSSGAFSRKNVVGAIEINQTNNKGLRDKSNREGFIENDAFTDFYSLLKAILREAFNLFGEDRGKVRAAEEASKRELVPAVVQLEQSVNLVAQALNQAHQMADRFVQEELIAPEVAEQITLGLRQTGEALTAAVEETKQATADTIKQFDEERDMLLALAGLGLAAERFTHEFARMTREASDLLHEIEKHPNIQQANHLRNRVEALGVTLEALRDLVLALGPMFYIRRKTSEKSLDVKTIVGHALLLNKGQIEENHIQVEILEPQGGLSVMMRRGALTQVFNNLFDNSCYWLSRKSEETDRRIRVLILADERAVIVTDNGPGIHPRDQHRIFDVFFTTKTDGRGLGLFIAREALSEAQATMALIEPGEHHDTFRVGVSFRIQFPDKA
jgi:signal transduction histidine kinase